MTRDEMLDKREDVLDEFDARVDPSHGVMTLGEERWFTAQLLADEIVRLRAILAALREPSEAVVKAAVLHYSGDLQDAIRAAVAAAEAEASHDARATQEVGDATSR